MVAVHQELDLRFVEYGIFFQAGNPLFDAATEAGADFKVFTDGTVGPHGGLLQTNLNREITLALKKILGKAKVFSTCADISEEA
jgi:hypothetical protein